jgi:LuxR family transcriptional regulator, maltose regulon positive regulatory protein
MSSDPRLPDRMPVSAQLFPAKLRPPPTHVRLVERPRLYAKLEDALHHRLTLVHAPAGFGKTTLLSQWVTQLRAAGQTVGWFSFDRYDTDPLLFLAHIAESLPGIPTPIEPWTTHTALSRILGHIASLPQSVIVLDDYHLVQSSHMHDLVLRLLRMSPDNLHVVIASRSRNVLPLSYLQVQGQVGYLGAEDLTFSPEEAGQLFGGTLPPELLQQLVALTRGWPVAARIVLARIERGNDAGRAMQQVAGAEGDIATYLTEQVMAGLPPPLRRFLLQTSVVDEINGDLADALCGGGEGWGALDSLDRLGALWSLPEGSGRWRRYHPLFASYLRVKSKSLGEQRLRALHMAASGWYASHNDIERAVYHAATSGNFAGAADLIEDAGPVWLSVEHGLEHLRRLLAYLPAPFVDGRPRLRMARALLWVKDGRAEPARLEMEDVCATIHRAPVPCADQHAQRDSLIVSAAIAGQRDEGVAPGVLAVLEKLTPPYSTGAPCWTQAIFHEAQCTAFIGNGSAHLAQLAGREAVRIYDEYDAAAGRIFGRLLLGGALLARGNLTEAQEVLSIADAMGRQRIPGDTATLAMVRLLLAQAHYERNDLESARELCDIALPQVEQAEGSLELYHSGYWVASGLRLARGDPDGALRIVERGLLMAKQRRLKRLQRVLYYQRLDALSRLDSAAPPSLRNTLDLFHRQQVDMGFLEREVAIMTLARLSILRGQAMTAAELIESRLGACEEYGRDSVMIRFQILLALARRHLEQTAEATRAVRRAIALAAPEHNIRAFLDEGPEIFELLDEALRYIGINNLESGEVRLLGEIFAARLHPVARQEVDSAQIFKPREREVLSGLCNGLSNKALARQLELTDDAIKYHLKKIYAKLGVSDRTMAVVVARQHGIVNDRHQSKDALKHPVLLEGSPAAQHK